MTDFRRSPIIGMSNSVINSGFIPTFVARVLNSIVLFIFPIPRINNTKSNTFQEYSILTKKIFFLIILLHFSPYQTILSIF